MELKEESDSTGSTFLMVVDALKCSDVGNYTCTVFGMSGDASGKTNVDIMGKT